MSYAPVSGNAERKHLVNCTSLGIVRRLVI